MSEMESAAHIQECPSCRASVDLTGEEPLSRVTCPNCGEKFRVERAFDNFELLETLGVGGMGSVYKARDTRLDRMVALKILRKELSADPAEARRLEQEARATAAVNHPHVVQVFSSGIDHGQFYLVIELVGHGSLDDLMAEQGKLAETQVIETGLQVAQGLHAAHEKGLVHRDIKPANILYANEHEAKIGDFGLAVAAGQAAEAQSEIWGTPYYVAPERLDNEPEDFRSDIYSLGATLFHAVAGRPPIDGETNSASALRDLKSCPVDLGAVAPGLKRQTVQTIKRMMAPDPAQRFNSYPELIEELQCARRALDPVGQKIRRMASPMMLTALATFILLAAGAIYFYKAKSDRANKAALAARLAGTGDAALGNLYDDARRELIAGRTDSARAVFNRLQNEAKNRQPLLNWIRLHRGLAALLRGYSTQAREAFQEIESAGPFSTKPENEALAVFFVETARTMMAPASVPATMTLDAKGPQAFALFLYAMKDWQQNDFTNAAAFLEKFLGAQPAPAFAWINDYKPLAQKYLGDYRVYAEWKKQPDHFEKPEQVAAALTLLRASQKKLQLRGRLADALKEDEARLSSQPKPVGQSAGSPPANSPLPDKETALWNETLSNYKKKLAVYDFAGALGAITAPRVNDSTLKANQQMTEKKARWLITWKERLVADLNSSGYTGSVTDVSGAEYKGAITRATPARITLKTSYGILELEWPKFNPETFLAISTSFIKTEGPENADRRWLSAVFAAETGQMESARRLATEAAKAKPEYRAEAGQLLPQTSTTR